MMRRIGLMQINSIDQLSHILDMHPALLHLFSILIAAMFEGIAD